MIRTLRLLMALARVAAWVPLASLQTSRSPRVADCQARHRGLCRPTEEATAVEAATVLAGAERTTLALRPWLRTAREHQDAWHVSPRVGISTADDLRLEVKGIGRTAWPITSASEGLRSVCGCSAGARSAIAAGAPERRWRL